MKLNKNPNHNQDYSEIPIFENCSFESQLGLNFPPHNMTRRAGKIYKLNIFMLWRQTCSPLRRIILSDYFSSNRLVPESRFHL